MLKSTYKPSANLVAAAPPLPPGWSEHKAPSGHTYYYNAETKESTYRHPGLAAGAFEPPAGSMPPLPPAPQLRLSDPNVANAFMAQYRPPAASSRGGFGNGRGGRAEQRPRPQPIDKPRSKVAIPGCEPWLLVYTKYGRRFAFNPVKNASYWRIPEKLKAGILELDQARIREKAEPADRGRGASEGAEATAKPEKPRESQVPTSHDHNQADFDSSEYEEVEVTDDEADEEEGEDGNPRKRQRTEEAADAGPVEFNEADIAYQLQALGEGYGLDAEQYPDADAEDWQAGGEQPGLSEEDARELFKDLLNDFNTNPYSPWEKLIEEGKVFDDPRYTVLTTMKARRDAWEEWSRDKIKELKERRAKEEKRDPRIPYLALLQERATPKLYWPEFKRKYKKEAAMKDATLSDKDREKWYREYISRLKLPQSTLKSDLTALLKSTPLSKLNNQTLPSHLPPQILTDMRYVSLDAKIRDPLVEAYIQSLGPPPEDAQAFEEDEAAQKAREDRRRRERALQERERAVAEEKKRQQKKLEYGKALLREEERELERAMQVSKKGLQSQLASAREDGQ